MHFLHYVKAQSGIFCSAFLQTAYSKKKSDLGFGNDLAKLEVLALGPECQGLGLGLEFWGLTSPKSQDQDQGRDLDTLGQGQGLPVSQGQGQGLTTRPIFTEYDGPVEELFDKTDPRAVGRHEAGVDEANIGGRVSIKGGEHGTVTDALHRRLVPRQRRVVSVDDQARRAA